MDAVASPWKRYGLRRRLHYDLTARQRSSWCVDEFITALPRRPHGVPMALLLERRVTAFVKPLSHQGGVLAAFYKNAERRGECGKNKPCPLPFQVSGLSKWFASKLALMDYLEPWVLNLVLCLIMSGLTEFISNPAVNNLMMPILSSLVRTPHVLITLHQSLIYAEKSFKTQMFCIFK